MRILGIDPGYATIGFGLITAERAQVNMLTYGAITTPGGAAALPAAVPDRHRMEDLIGQLKPDVISIEELFFNTNLTTGYRRGPRPRRAAVHGGKVRDPAPRVHPLPGEDGGGGLRPRRKSAR